MRSIRIFNQKDKLHKPMIIAQQYKILISLLAVISLVQLTVMAGEPAIWETTSRAEILRGEARGISITDTGALMLAPRFTELYNTGQTYIWSSAVDKAGSVYLGTGHDGRIYKVGPDGRGALFYDAPELDVTALVVGFDGALYAGTSPDGKVYRIDSSGKGEVFFDPPDKYIWSLALLANGAIAVGTGDSGKIYQVRKAGSKPEDSLLYDTSETHVISMAVDRSGNLIAGTDPGGLILRISMDGKAFALFDAPLREIHSLAVGDDGSIFALALSDAAISRSTTVAPSADGSEGRVSTTVTITGIEEGAPVQTVQARSRSDLSNAKSALFRVLPDGATDTLWVSTSVTAFSLAPSPNKTSVLIGTSDKGRIYSVSFDGRDTLLVQSTEGQISSLLSQGREIYAASSNQGKVFKLETAPVTEGSYESPVRDARLVASWGRIWWRGRGAVELQTRSGNTERPDTTWSEWSVPYKNPRGEQVASPRARFIQWRAVLRSAGSGHPSVEEVSLAYLPRNVAPEVLSITVLPVGVGLQPAPQIVLDPNIESSGLDPGLFGVPPQIPPRRVYQRGARSFQWQAEDRNGDMLVYSIYYRSLNETSFRLLKDNLRESFFTVDGAALADGRYVFKIVASDAPSNPVEQALTGERISEPIEIDNTPPVIRVIGTPRVAGGQVRVAFDVEDATGRIKRADVSIDGGPWIGLFPDDGIADSGRETYTVTAPVSGNGEHTVSLRAFDTSGNVGSLRVLIR